jgi:hypothetical protein
VRRGVPILISLVALADPARAESKTEVLPRRPTIACTAQIEAPGVLVMEAGYLRKDLAGATQHSVPFLLKLKPRRLAAAAVRKQRPDLLRSADLAAIPR